MNGYQGTIRTVTASAIIALGGWTLTISQRVSKVETFDRRIDGLESGRTTPMAAETRAEFMALRREISDLRSDNADKDKRIGEMHTAMTRLLERLIDTAKPKSK